MSQDGKTMRLDEYSLQQLEQINNGMTQELQYLTGSLGNLRLALNKYRNSMQALEGLKAAKETKKEVLVPLTSSLYVPGTVENVEKVTVDIGTGYYADIGLEAGETFFQKRVDMLIRNIETAQTAIMQKREELAAVRKVMTMKSEGLAAAQQQAMAKIDALGSQ